MPDGATVIGKVAIKVIPDTTGFKGEAQRDLDRIEHQLDPIKIKMELASISKRKVQAEMSVLTRRRSATIAPEIDNAAAAKVGATLAALSGGRSIGNIGKDLSEWVGELDKQTPKIAAVSLAISNLASVALTSGANLFSLGSSLASIAPAALALPGIFGGLAIGVTAFAVSMKDFNKHVPEFAVGLGRSVKAGEAWKQLQDKMSNKFWAGAQDDIRTLVNTLFPQFSRGMQSISTDLGTFTGKLAKALTGGLNGELQHMFDDLGQSIRVMARHTNSLAGILQKLGSVGAGNLPKLAGWVGDIADSFDAWLGRKGQAGLQGLVDTGVQGLKDLGATLGSTASLFAGLARAAEASGATTLQTLRRTMASAADTVNSPKFQNALTHAFDGARKGLDALSNNSGKQFRSFMLRLSDTLSNTLPKAGEAAGTALGAIFGALDQPAVENAILTFFDRINTVVNTLAPSLPAVAQGLAAIVDVIGKIGVNTSRGLAPLLDSVGKALPGLSSDLGPLIDQLGKLVENLAQMGSAVVPALAKDLGGVAKSLAAALAPLNSFLDLLQKLPQPIKDVGSQLVAIGIIVMAGTWLGGAAKAKVVGFSESLLTMATNAKVGQTALLNTAAATESIGTKMSRARVGIGLGVLALSQLASSAAQGNDAVQGLSNVLSGAAVGFSVGGPWGAAIGAAGGGLITLAQHFNHSRDAANKAYSEMAKTNPVKQAQAALGDLVGTLDQVTGAYTGATRAAVLQKLQQAGLVDVAAKFGISARAVVNAALGQKGAMQGLASVVDSYQRKIASLDAATQAIQDDQSNWFTLMSNGHVVGREMTTSALEQVTALQKQKKALQTSLSELQQMPGALKSMAKQTRENAAATQDYNGKLKGIPKDVKTDILQNGMEPSTKAIADLTRKYDLTPKQVKTLIEASGADTSVAKVQNLIDRLNALHDKTITVTTITRHVGGNIPGGNKPIPVPGVTPKQATDAGNFASQLFSEAFAKHLDKLKGKVTDAFQKLLDKASKQGGKKAAEKVKDEFGNQIGHLNDLVKQHNKLMNQLSHAQDTLQKYQDKWQSLHDTVRDTIISASDITQLGAKTYQGLIRALTQAAGKAVEFQNVMAQLTAQGLNATSLNQLLAAGPSALDIAKQILAGGVGQVNNLQAIIDAAAEATGTGAAQHFFGDLVAGAQSDVDKLLKQLGPLQAKLKQFAHDLIKSLSDALKKEWKQQMGDGGKDDGKGGKNPPKTPSSPKGNAFPGLPGSVIQKQVNLTYNAAPGRSISSEEDLWEALGRAG